VLRVWIARRLVTDPPNGLWAVFIIKRDRLGALAYFATRLQERLPSAVRATVAGTGFLRASHT